MSKNAPRQKPSLAELRVWSGEHLIYEPEMLKLYVQLQRIGKYTRDKAPIGLETEYHALNMALLEGLVVHTRALYEFFFELVPERPKFYQDARAADFVDNPKDWYDMVDLNQLKAGLDQMNVKERVGYEVAHLTYKRPFSTAKVNWEWTDMYRELAKTIKKFIAEVPAGRLAQDVVNFPVEL